MKTREYPPGPRRGGRDPMEVLSQQLDQRQRLVLEMALTFNREDLRRLQFCAWLVERGLLNEGF